jgi:hypothetical protein
MNSDNIRTRSERKFKGGKPKHAKIDTSFGKKRVGFASTASTASTAVKGKR